MIDLTPIFEAVIGVVAIAITAILIPYIKSKLTNSQFEKLSAVIRVAVLAAEEAAYSGLIPKSEKYEYAVSYLEGCGYTFDEDEMRKLIDAYVREIFNHFKEA